MKEPSRVDKLRTIVLVLVCLGALGVAIAYLVAP
jgi:hypothetical protein